MGNVWSLIAFTKEAFKEKFGDADLATVIGVESYVLGSDSDYIYLLVEPSDVQFLENDDTYRPFGIWQGRHKNNMDIIKGENKITVPGYTGHGQKRGALFTVNGAYIYTVHSDHKKYAPL